MSTSISRAAFLKGMAGLGGIAGLAALGLCGTPLVQMLNKSRHQFPMRLLGPSRELGHILRDPLALKKLHDSPIAATKRYQVCIVGGGMAGLSAGWWLKRNGITDFVILELEKNVGGNASWGSNQYGSYPWGAHYIPIPNVESIYVRELLTELNILQGYNDKQEPIYDELTLCHEPQERLFKDGAFHEGLVPKRGLQEDEAADIARFFGMMVAFRQATGKDGKLAFAIPLDLSSQDATYLDLDKITISQWLSDNKFASKPLLWYVNYCCRDDYGSTLENVSAWAGIHYFAGRRGTAANAEQNAVLTWAQGNGYLAERLREGLKEQIQTNSLVTEVTSSKTIFKAADGSMHAIASDYVIFAAPRFVARHVITEPDFQAQSKLISALNYAPWMVANISLKKLSEAHNATPAWDNVSYYGESLGYVTASHQEITTRQKPYVITYYYPLSQKAPKASRQDLYTADVEHWKKIIIEDLVRMHPDIEDEILAIDLWPWGHGMVRPDVGFIWGKDRQTLKNNIGNIYFAHSDMSGMSNFEEAQYHGVEAAKTIIERMKVG